jgi:hypothetical protein
MPALRDLLNLPHAFREFGLRLVRDALSWSRAANDTAIQNDENLLECVCFGAPIPNFYDELRVVELVNTVQDSRDDLSTVAKPTFVDKASRIAYAHFQGSVLELLLHFVGYPGVHGTRWRAKG